MITFSVLAPSITWWLVMMKPSELITTPLPEPARPSSSSRLWTVTIEGMAREATTATRSAGANTGTVVLDGAGSGPAATEVVAASDGDGSTTSGAARPG